MAENMDFETIKRKLKVEKVKAGFREHFVDPVKREYTKWKPFLYEHRFQIVGVVAAGAVKITRDSYKHKRKMEEERERDTRMYDRRTDSYVYSKRPLTKRQAMELDRRYREGENKREILYDMGLLSR